MDYIKKHYEKVVLAALLLVFLLAMFYLLGIMKDAKKISPEQLKIEKRTADYAEVNQANPKDEKFDMPKQFQETVVEWSASQPRERDASDASGSTYLHKDYYSDLLAVFPISLCPKCKHLIPRVFFGRNCPNPKCQEKLPEVIPFSTYSMTLQGKAIEIPVVAIEKEFSPDDVLDIDKDGFSAIYEKTLKTDPMNGDSHPPYWYRLSVVNCGKSELPVYFSAVSGKEERLRFQIDVTVWKLYRGRKISLQDSLKTQSVKLNDVIEIPFGRAVLVGKKIKQPRKVKYKLVKFEPGSGKKQKGREVTPPQLLLKSLDKNFGDITMVLKKKVYAPNSDVTLLDTGSNIVYAGFLEDDVITIKSKQYRIRKIDVEKNCVHLIDLTKKENPQLDEFGHPMIVTKEGKIPETQRVGYKPPEKAAPQDGGDAPKANAPQPAAAPQK